MDKEKKEIKIDTGAEAINTNVSVEEPDSETKTTTAEKRQRSKTQRTGIVSNCFKLNVREEPSTDAIIIGEIKLGDNVKLLDKGSTKEFYHITTNDGIEGFCMKEFISINK